MANVFRSAGSWLGGMFRRHASGQALYKRGTSSVVLLAHKGACQVNVEGEVFRLSSEWRDWFIDENKLVLPGVGRTLPEASDLIEEIDGSTVYVYEVLAPLDEEKCYQWTSANRQRLRIHTKEIDTR